ncbi:MAG: methylisocitrate lyase [Coxiellaceae bacterium]|nr:methylisocitrate lyase [Coxiellaceae bacterium]
MESASKKFREALNAEKPLQIVGAINAYCALMAERVGYKALYVSGAGVANMSYGIPDLGFTTLENVLEDVYRISRATDLPVLVDIDTGWEEEGGVAHTVAEMIKAGAAAVHIEDQVSAKRCGHRPNKTLVSCDEMVTRVKAAVEGRTDSDFYIIARTDAVASEGIEAAIDRANAYIDAGADAIFAEALTDIDQYKLFCEKIKAPVLANITEFGKTPLYTLDELRQVGVAMALYPLSAVRAMNQAAMNIYQAIRDKGTQKECLHAMQDRETLYDILNYYQYEKSQDEK